MSTTDQGTTVKVWGTPTWLTALSNRELMAHHRAAGNARGPGDDPGLDRRIEMLNDELRRRRSIGQLLDDDLNA